MGSRAGRIHLGRCDGSIFSPQVHDFLDMLIRLNEMLFDSIDIDSQ